jgi:hypothetical protein
LGHPLGRKPLLKYPSDIATIQSVKRANCFDGLGFILHDKTGHAMVYNLGNRSATPSDYRRAASHSFNHHWPSPNPAASRRLGSPKRPTPVFIVRDANGQDLRGDRVSDRARCHENRL